MLFDVCALDGWFCYKLFVLFICLPDYLKQKLLDKLEARIQPPVLGALPLVHEMADVSVQAIWIWRVPSSFQMWCWCLSC